LQPVKYGVIGVGGMGADHCRQLHEMPETELASVADLNEQAARETGEKYGARFFTDYKKLIRNGGVEAIVIVTPHYFHPPIAQYAARHGVHVMSEKPIAVSVKAADKMVRSCREAGVLLGVNFQRRTDAWRKKVHDMVQDGELGEIHRISLTAPWYRTQTYYNSGAWRGTWKGEGGGVLMNQAPHSLDQFLWIGGQPQSIQAIATTRLHEIEVENTTATICDYGNGKVGLFYVSTAEAGTSETLEVVGDKGALIWNHGKLLHMKLAQSLSEHLKTGSQWGEPENSWSEIEIPEDGNNHAAQIFSAFTQAIRKNDPSLIIADGQAGVRALELANAMLLAGYTRREVKLPLDRNKFENLLKKLQNGAKPEEFYRGRE